MSSRPAPSRIVNSLFSAAANANRSWPRERAAAVKIQSAVRMHQQRARFTFIRACAIRVQRVFRGYCGRIRVLDICIAKAKQRRARIFHLAARNIQRVFRGFLCRKYTNDFCAMKAYLAHITQTSEGIRQDALKARHEQEAYLAEVQATELRSDFKAAIRDKHHLLSTAVSAGVLRAPLQPDGTRTVFGTDIEEEIRAVPIERPKRSKFLRDIIPPAAASAPASPGRSRQQAAAASSSESGSKAGGSSKEGDKRLKFSAPKPTYQKTLQSESEYESSDGGAGRLIEEQIVSSLHPKGGYFQVSHMTERGPTITSGYTGSRKL